MPAPNVDIVFVVDASGIMGPCFKQLCDHLTRLLLPIQGFVSKVRFGLVTVNVGSMASSCVHCLRGIGGISLLDALYGAPANADRRSHS